MFNCSGKISVTKRRITAVLVLGLAVLLEPGYADSIDPTRPYDFVPRQNAVSTSGVGGALALTSVMISNGHRSAIINNTLVKVGDKVGENVVKQIEPYTVSLMTRDGKLIKLYLFVRTTK